MQTRPRPASNTPPLTGHALFVPAVALWTAALFGLSSLAVRAALFERWVLDSGFARLLPVAAPPLGHGARMLFALGLAVPGALLGLGVARLLARPTRPAAEASPDAGAYRVRARDAHPDAPPRRPVSAHEELIHAESLASAAPRADGDPVPAPVRSAAERIAGAHPGELSLVELIERLAIALQSRGLDSPPVAQESAAQHHAREAAIANLCETLDQLRGTAA